MLSGPPGKRVRSGGEAAEARWEVRAFGHFVQQVRKWSDGVGRSRKNEKTRLSNLPSMRNTYVHSWRSKTKTFLTSSLGANSFK
jgi:hypothetical protein